MTKPAINFVEDHILPCMTMMSMYLVVPLTTPRVFTTLAFAEFWEDRNRGNNISTVGIIVIGRICCVIVFRPFSSDDCVKSIKMLGFQVVIIVLLPWGLSVIQCIMQAPQPSNKPRSKLTRILFTLLSWHIEVDKDVENTTQQ